MKRNRTESAGFTLVEIMIVVAIMGLLASIAIPNYVIAQKKAKQVTCIGNLRQIEGAVQTWIIETRKDADQPVQYTDISSYLKNSVVCPSGGTSFEDSYQVTSSETRPVCLRVPSGDHAHRLAL